MNGLLAVLMLLVCFGQILSLLTGSIAFIILRDALMMGCVALLVLRSPQTAALRLTIGLVLLLIPGLLVEALGPGQANPQQFYLATRNALTPWLVAITACAIGAVAAFPVSGDVPSAPAGALPVTPAERIIHLALLYLAVEFLVILLAPNTYAIFDTAVTLFLETKGVEANSAAGLLADYRARTSLMNPVQGAWLFLIYFLFLRNNGNRPLVAVLAVAVATVAKVAIVALLAFALLRSRAAVFIGPLLIVGAMAAPIVAFDAADIEVHLYSALFRVQGLVSAWNQFLQNPFGVGLLNSGVIGAGVQKRVVPGMESGFGVILSAFGLPGMMHLLAVFFVMAVQGRVQFALALVLLIGIVSSENVMVPYLYAPLVLFLAHLVASRSHGSVRLARKSVSLPQSADFSGQGLHN